MDAENFSLAQFSHAQAGSEAMLMNTSVMPSAISCQGLSVSYGEKEVLSRLSVEIPEGSMTAIIGPNGAGKSTWMKAVLGLLPKNAGTVRIFGEEGKKAKNYLSYIPQSTKVNWDFPITVEEVVEMASYKKRGWFLPIRNEDREKRDKALEEMGLTELRKRQISQLSGGQKQKVFLARALAEEAKLFLLDEPFAAIDQKSERSITEKLKEFKKMGKTILCIHHDLSRLQENFDYILWIKAGSYGFGRAEEVLSPENVEAINFYTDLVHKYKVAPSADDYSRFGLKDGQPDPLFAQGHCAINITGFWNVGSLESVEGLNWDMAPMWKNKVGATFSFGSGLAITKGGKNVDAAFRAIEFLTSLEGQKPIVENKQDAPANVELLQSDLFLKPAWAEGKNMNFNAFAESADIIVSPPLHPKWNEIQRVFDENFSVLFAEGGDCSETLKKIEKELNEVIK